jgi:hypothetical protein
MATIEIGAIRWIPGDGRITSGWSEPVTVTTLPGGAPAMQTTTRAVGLDAVLVPGRERRALIHVPREEWTALHVQVLCWRIVTWWAVGVVLHESVLPLLVTGDPEALPTAITVIGAGFWVNDRLRRRLH